MSTDPIATYLLTQEKEPFCASHYKVSVKVSESEESRRHGGEIGILYIRLRSGYVETRKIQVNSIPVYFSPGTNHSFLAIGDDLSEDIERVKVEYKFKQTFNPLTWRINSPRVYIEYLVIESMEHNRVIKVCPHHKLPVGEEKEGTIFRPDACDYKKQ
jgi:pancreatic triacylglycerol lipase